MDQGQVNHRSQWRAWLNAAALLIASWIAVAALSLQASAGADVIAVIFPPWWNTQQVFAAAASSNVSIVRTTALPSLLVVRSDEQNGLVRLRQAGVWFTINPQVIGACLQEPD